MIVALNSSLQELLNKTPTIKKADVRCRSSVCDNCTARSAVSQWGEDRLLLSTLLRASGGRPGTFVEIGALDGQRLSNTLLLERCYGWNGLLIEANPINYRALVKSGRSKSRFEHSAVCKGENKTVNFSRAGDAMAGQADFSGKSRTRLHHGYEPVRCSSLTQIMYRNGLVHGATFLSLDVEGAEMSVLQTAPLGQISIVLVEMSGLAADNHVENFLFASGLLPLLKIRLEDEVGRSLCKNGGCSDVFVTSNLL